MAPWRAASMAMLWFIVSLSATLVAAGSRSKLSPMDLRSTGSSSCSGSTGVDSGSSLPSVRRQVERVVLDSRVVRFTERPAVIFDRDTGLVQPGISDRDHDGDIGISQLTKTAGEVGSISRVDVRKQTTVPVADTGSLTSAPWLRLNHSWAKLLLVACSICYASNYSTTKFLQDSIPPTIVNTLRFFIGALCFLPALPTMSRQPELILRSAELGLWCAIGFIGQALNLRNTPAGKVSLFGSLSVVVSPLVDLACKVYDSRCHRRSAKGGSSVATVEVVESTTAPKKINRRSLRNRIIRAATSKFAAPMVAVAGACALEWGGVDAPHLSDIFLLVTPISFALAFWRSETLAEKYPEDITTVTAVMLGSVSLLSLLWASLTGELPRSTSDALQLLRLVWRQRDLLVGLLVTGILATAATAVVEQKALRLVSAADTTLIYSMEPIFASWFAWMFVGEEITANVLVGAGCILAACGWDSVRKVVRRRLLR